MSFVLTRNTKEGHGNLHIDPAPLSTQAWTDSLLRWGWWSIWLPGLIRLHPGKPNPTRHSQSFLDHALLSWRTFGLELEIQTGNSKPQAHFVTMLSPTLESRYLLVGRLRNLVRRVLGSLSLRVHVPK